MEQQEEKKTKTDYKKKRTGPKPSTSFFHMDVTTEILLRLPEKSVGRLSCVSKLWLSITTDPSFISLYEKRNPSPRFLICFQKNDDLFVSSIPQHTQNPNRSYSSSLSIDHHHMTKFPDILRDCSYTESVHGLICFESDTPIVWNPSTRQFLTLPALPKPNKCWNTTILFLGYDPVEGKHKVVCIPYDRTCYACRVFTLGSGQESWRTVRINNKHKSSWCSSGRCIKGVIYYLAYTCQEFDTVIMSFDVRSEKFGMIKQPSDFHGSRLITYKGRLACFDEDEDDIRFCILEDAQKHKWLTKKFLSPFGDFNLTNGIDFNLKGFTRDGEFICVPDEFSQSFYMLLWDPVRNSCRRFEFKGMADDETGLHYGVEDVQEVEEDEEEDGPKYSIHTFPNHIDSQMSL